MIRFRFTEDERRYLHLLSESYRIIASNLPPALASQVMRNLGKLEQMASLEGVRQGLAVAELSQLSLERGGLDARALKAFQAHAAVYGSTDTPMRDVELEWLEKLGLNEDTASGAWLDKDPLRYAPATLAEWDPKGGTTTTPHFARLEDLDPKLIPPHLRGETFDGGVEVDPRFTSDDFLDEEKDVQERPALLDQIRDVLVAAEPKPDSWQQLIMLVHRATGVDAGFLDIQMSTEMGRTVLTQCGIHIDPGVGIDLSQINS